MRASIIKKTLLVIALAFICASSLIAETAVPFKGRIIADNINVRLDSTISSTVICVLNKDTCVDVVLGLYDWYKIKLPKTAPSFIRKDLVEVINTTDKPQTNIEPANTSISCAKVTKDRVNVRLKPDEAAFIIGKTTNNEVVNIVEESGNWYKIQPVNESFGWVHKKFIEEGCNLPAKEKIIPAKQQVNPPQKPAVTISGQNITVEGVIKACGRFFNRAATHKIILADNQTYLLRGDKKNLDPLNGRKVKITGIVPTQQNLKNQIIEVQKIEVVD